MGLYTGDGLIHGWAYTWKTIAGAKKRILRKNQTKSVTFTVWMGLYTSGLIHGKR